MKENGSSIGKKQKIPRINYLGDYADDTALLTNTPAQAESLLHSVERVGGGIGLHVNADKTEYMCFNQRGDISTQNGWLLELVDKSTYLGSSVIINRE